MIDMEHIRREPEAFRRAIAAKRIPLKLDDLLEADKQRRALVRDVEELRQKRNRITEFVAAQAANREQHIEESRLIGLTLATKETELQKIDAEFQRLMAYVP